MKKRVHGEGVSETADKAAQNHAIVIVAVIIVLLFLFTAAQNGCFGSTGCLPIGTAPAGTSAGDAPVSVTDVPSGSDAGASGTSPTDAEPSDSDVPSPSDAIVVYYPEVHIDGITLPEQYGAGLFDPNAAMWLINEYRQQNGLYQLLPGEFGLQQVTRIRLLEAMEQFSHDRPDGSAFSTAYDQTGLFYRHCAENLASGQYTAEEVVQDWINSDSHRANLLSTTVTHMCVMAGTREDGRTIWVFEAYSAP